jgi:hypothetical protein
MGRDLVGHQWCYAVLAKNSRFLLTWAEMISAANPSTTSRSAIGSSKVVHGSTSGRTAHIAPIQPVRQHKSNVPVTTLDIPMRLPHGSLGTYGWTISMT